jgi:hypothetical protein
VKSALSASRSGSIKPVVTHVPVEQSDIAGWTKVHVRQPVGEHSTQVVSAGAVAVNNDGEDAARKVARIAPASSSRFAHTASLPWVLLRSGLPPSAQTIWSIISLRAAGAWYQWTGQMIMIPCAATHIG